MGQSYASLIKMGPSYVRVMKMGKSYVSLSDEIGTKLLVMKMEQNYVCLSNENGTKLSKAVFQRMFWLCENSCMVQSCAKSMIQGMCYNE